MELALDAAHQAKDAWAKTSLTKRVDILLKIADRLEANLELLAVAETWKTTNLFVRRSCNTDRMRLDKLLSHLPCPCGVWRLQTIGH